eukprot:1014611-Pyramimonas_sp.AAC.1
MASNSPKKGPKGRQEEPARDRIASGAPGSGPDPPQGTMTSWAGGGGGLRGCDQGCLGGRGHTQIAPRALNM